MINLFKYELFKLYKNPLYKIFLIIVLFMEILPIIYFKHHNLTIAQMNSSYVTSQNFPYQILQEILPFLFNISIIFFSTYIMSEIGNNNACIYALTRGVNIFKLTIIKILVLIIYFSIIILLLYLSSILIGITFFDKCKYITPFFTNIKLYSISAYIYSLKFYMYGLLSICSIITLMILINIFLKNVNLSIALGIIYIFIGLIIPPILINYNDKYTIYCISSIPFLQNKLLPLALINNNANNIFLGTTIIYMFLCISLIYILCKNLEF